MDYIEELGTLALASRLRRLLDELLRDGRKVYGELNLDFEVRWFAVFHFLAHNHEACITDIAKSLRLRHPTVIQVVGEMAKRGLLSSKPDGRDGRVRRVALTSGGRVLAERLRPVWQAFDEAGRQIATEQGNDFLQSLAKIESALKRQTVHERIHSSLQADREE